MSRHKKVKKKILPQDIKYKSRLITRIINKILVKGKKSLAQYTFYKTMNNIKKIKKKDPLEIFRKAIKNTTPSYEIRSFRKKGRISKIAIQTNRLRRIKMALKFIITSARKRLEKNIILKLQNEILDAYHNIGISVKKKFEINKFAKTHKILYKKNNKKIIFNKMGKNSSGLRKFN